MKNFPQPKQLEDRADAPRDLRGSREPDRRNFLQWAGYVAGAALANRVLPAGAAVRQEASRATLLRVEMPQERAGIPFLSWDTEGGDRASRNLLRAGAEVSLRIQQGGTWLDSRTCPAHIRRDGENETVSVISLGRTEQVEWRLRRSGDAMEMAIGEKQGANSHAVEILFPFDAMVTPAAIIPSRWDGEEAVLPAILSAPDFGQMYLESDSHAAVKVRLEGDRERHIADMLLEVPERQAGETFRLRMTPLVLPAPHGMRDKACWKQVRRGWFNVWQPSFRWGSQRRPFSAPAGILSNNVISDPVSFALPFYADQALFTPELAGGVSIMTSVRHTIEWWLDQRTDPSGEVIGYWDYRHFLDANPGILIASWDYVEATKDEGWLRSRIGQLEKLAGFLESRDIDDDGMIEATQSGNAGTLVQPGRSCCWWDALNCGHKDGYSNAFIYRAFLCLADLEGMLGDTAKQAHYVTRARRLRKTYSSALYNQETGWLGWWRSADGRLHDYATPVVNGLAIDYGLVEPALGRKILERLWSRMQQAGFEHMELGLPCTLEPVLRADYLHPDGAGMPQREDGTDTFQQYMNGGISAGHTLHFILAHHAVGWPEKGDELLKRMLQRQHSVGFQNGVQNKGGRGVDWTDWQGRPTGYEGYLADVFQFLQAAVLREPELRSRLHRPLLAANAET